jgi:hypothetical protein
MSASYMVKGYIDIRLPINDTFSCSQSSTPNDIAEIVKSHIVNTIGSCEILNHGFKLERIS